MLLNVDSELLKKYDRPGPRYTSYPTAPYFHEGVSAQVLQSHYKSEQEHQSQGISLYFHIPFCDTLCWFCGCNTQITQDRKKIESYLDDLELEMDLVRPLLAPSCPVVQLHWGGGTPTHLLPHEIIRLGRAIRKRFDIAEHAEMSVEIDPRELTWEHVDALRQVGFNRCSLGVQDFTPAVQKAVNRIQPESMTRQVVEWVRKAGFKSVNLDLMYGLPLQTQTSFQETLEKAVALNPDRLAMFSFAYLPDLKKHQKLIHQSEMPNAELKMALLKQGMETLGRFGYEYIGMDHFAKPQDELTQAMNNGTLYRNFQGYSTHAGISLIGFGVTAIGMTQKTYTQNVRSIEEYSQKVRAGQIPTWRGVELTQEDQMRREIITALMCNLRLEFAVIEKRYGVSFKDHFFRSLELLNELEQDHLVKMSDQEILVLEAGRLFVRNIAMCFDAYLDSGRVSAGTYSRTV